MSLQGTTHERTKEECNKVGDKNLEVVIVGFQIYIMQRDDLKEEKKNLG
jgi:hypothetical protein